MAGMSGAPPRSQLYTNTHKHSHARARLATSARLTFPPPTHTLYYHPSLSLMRLLHFLSLRLFSDVSKLFFTCYKVRRNTYYRELTLMLPIERSVHR